MTPARPDCSLDGTTKHRNLARNMHMSHPGNVIVSARSSVGLCSVLQECRSVHGGKQWVEAESGSLIWCCVFELLRKHRDDLRLHHRRRYQQCRHQLLTPTRDAEHSMAESHAMFALFPGGLELPAGQPPAC